MLELLNPQVLPTIAGATLALMVSALAQRVPRRWAGPGRSQAPLPPEAQPDAAQAALSADTPPPSILRVTEARARRRYQRREVAVMEFLEFLRARGNTGWFASEHIDDLWQWYCDVHSVVEMDPRLIRAELAAMPACRHGQKRLNGPEFIELKTALGRDRAHVYYIPPAHKPMPCRAAPSGGGAGQAGGRQSSVTRTDGARKHPRKRVLVPAGPPAAEPAMEPEWRVARAA